jgi:hypothetical protein
MSNIDHYVGNPACHKVPWKQSAAPFTCRVKSAIGECLPGEEFCAFEFPWCEGCPRSLVGKAAAKEDPLKSSIWNGWINGIDDLLKEGRHGEVHTQREPGPVQKRLAEVRNPDQQEILLKLLAEEQGKDPSPKRGK